jgi:hypothetical protein
VVQTRADDLVAGAQLAPGGGGEAHRHRGHARPERHAVRIAADQRADGRARGGDELVGVPGRREQAAVVGVMAGAHPVVHGLDRRVDHLGAGGPVQARPAVAQSGEALAVHVATFRSSSRSCS